MILKKMNEAIRPKLKFIKKDLKEFESLLIEINLLYTKIKSKSDDALKNASNDLFQEHPIENIPDQFIISTFAIVKEVCYRQLGILPYDVQLIGAIAMAKGQLIEMQTGEGKTLTAVFPAILHAFLGQQVHILTFNDYLAKRDATWMEGIYNFLGLSVDFITSTKNTNEKKLAYKASITYATAKEVGFDYLRSFMNYSLRDLIIPAFNYAIVDEADALLIDEARNPLVLAGDIIESDLDFHQIAAQIKKLQNGTDYEIDEFGKNVFLTEQGQVHVEQLFQLKNLQAIENHGLYAAINLALQAAVLIKKDIDYLVKAGKIYLIDEFTGRVIADRKWRNGLQTAVEAKEGLSINAEGSIINSITLQHLLQKYPKIAGMTATAQQSAEEFSDFYGFNTVVIPPNIPSKRRDFPDLLFTHQSVKNAALITEIKQINQTRQPILIGTLSVKESEELAARIKAEGIACVVLNAKNDEKEAAIIANAGRLGAVTISTNMAGRGTDIVLGGGDLLEKKQVIALGGLYVIGTNRHESRRIDQQLRGRSGRQGDVGCSRFFISFDDHLMTKYQFKEILPKKYRGLSSGEAIKNKTIIKFVGITQKIIESNLFNLRKNIYEYSTLLERQRMIIQSERQGILLQEKYQPVWLKDQKVVPELEKKLKIMALFLHDKFWALHLEELSQLRESIHLVRLGGQDPLLSFRKKADECFLATKNSIAFEIARFGQQLLAKPELSLAEIGFHLPSSTWTYVGSDNPFEDQLAITLLGNSNIGLQVDFFSLLILFFHSLWRKRRKRKENRRF